MKSESFITRHSKKPEDLGETESSEYPGLTEEGVDLAMEQAVVLAREVVDTAPDNAVIFIGGSSYQERTKSTGILYGEGLSEMYKDNDGVLVLTKEDIQNFFKSNNQDGVTRNLQSLAESMRSYGDKKVVLTHPLFLNEFDFGKNWGFWDENVAEEGMSSYFKYLYEKYGSDEKAAFKEWINTGGKTESKDIQGPEPKQVANSYENGLKRLKKFIQNFVGDRPIVVGAVGHRFDVDAYVLQTIGGEVNEEAFQKIMNGALVDETETVTVGMDNKDTKVKFRGSEYNLSKNHEEI